MKKKLIVLLLLFFPCLVRAGLYLGVETGRAYPLTWLHKYFSADIEYGLNFQVETEIPFIQLQLQGNYLSHTRDPFLLTLFPLQLNAVIILPYYKFRPFCSFGGGMIWETLKQDQEVTRNTDPVFNSGAGIEYQLKINRWILIPYLKSQYYFIYQKSQKLAEHNGEILTIDLGLRIKVM